jgi:hypothetical protein
VVFECHDGAVADNRFLETSEYLKLVIFHIDLDEIHAQYVVLGNEIVALGYGQHNRVRLSCGRKVAASEVTFPINHECQAVRSVAQSNSVSRDVVEAAELNILFQPFDSDRVGVETMHLPKAIGEVERVIPYV